MGGPKLLSRVLVVCAAGGECKKVAGGKAL